MQIGTRDVFPLDFIEGIFLYSIVIIIDNHKTLTALWGEIDKRVRVTKKKGLTLFSSLDRLFLQQFVCFTWENICGG